MVLTFGTHGVDQMLVQRYLCARSQSDATKAVVCSGFVVAAQFALFLFVGVALPLFYRAVPNACRGRRDRQDFLMVYCESTARWFDRFDVGCGVRRSDVERYRVP